MNGRSFTKTSQKCEAPKKVASPRILIKLVLSIIVVLVAVFFLEQPFVNLRTGSEALPHWNVILSAIVSPNFARDIWLGVDLPAGAVTGERLQAFGIGAIAILGMLFVGKLLFYPFQSSLRANKYENLFFSGVLGFIFTSFRLQIAGLLHHANAPLLPEVSFVILVGIFLLFCKIIHMARLDSSKADKIPSGKSSRSILILQSLLLVIFSLSYFCSSTQPLFEYDALEYHAQGAREIFDSGSIGFSSNNVYVNMPLGVEMFYTIGLVLARDFGYQDADILRIGLLIGKTVITSSVFLTALGLACFCSRFFNNCRCGLWSAIIFLSLPNLFEVYSNGLNDAVLGLATLSIVYVFFLGFEGTHPQTFRKGLSIAVLLGFISGFSASVKYTGVVFICIPTLILLIAFLLKHSFTKSLTANSPHGNENKRLKFKSKSLAALLTAIIFIASAFTVGGGWYLKNYKATGNPVYPLCYGLFGDATGNWNESVNARWKKAHSSADFGFAALKDSVARSLWKDDFNSPVYIYVPVVGFFALIGVCLGLRTTTETRDLKKLLTLFVIITAYWAAWFFLTHRLTRFLLPVAPLVSIVVGYGITKLLESGISILSVCALTVALISLLYSGILIDLLGQGRLAPLRSLERDPARYSQTALYFNAHPELLKTGTAILGRPKKTKILLVGDAKACAYFCPVVYSTCWNNSPLIPLLEPGIERDGNGKIIKIKDPQIIIAEFSKAEISYVCVDFNELARFKSEGNYGINNPEIDVNLFFLLVEAGVLAPFIPEELEGQEASSPTFKVSSLPVRK